MYRNVFKRFLDIVLTIILLLFLSPICIFLYILLLIFQMGNPLFKQKRLGKNFKIFTLYKFKSMNDERDADGNLRPDSERLTFIGNMLRKTSLDELPQLWNVLKGDMSLVGPRPLLPYYQDLYNDFQKRRNEVLPGITGLAQVNGRNHLEWDKRFELDVLYVDSLKFYLDIRILIKTVLSVFQFSKSKHLDSSIPLDFEGNTINKN